MEKTRQCLNDEGETVAITKCTKVMVRGLTSLQLLRRYITGPGWKTEVEQKLCNTQKCSKLAKATSDDQFKTLTVLSQSYCLFRIIRFLHLAKAMKLQNSMLASRNNSK